MIPNLNEKRRKRLRAEPRTTTGYRRKDIVARASREELFVGKGFTFYVSPEAVEDPPNECEEWNDFLRPYLN